MRRQFSVLGYGQCRCASIVPCIYVDLRMSEQKFDKINVTRENCEHQWCAAALPAIAASKKSTCRPGRRPFSQLLHETRRDRYGQVTRRPLVDVSTLVQEDFCYVRLTVCTRLM